MWISLYIQTVGGYNYNFKGSVLDGKVWDDRPTEIFVNHTTNLVKRLRDFDIGNF